MYAGGITFKSNEEKIGFCKMLAEEMAQMMPVRADKISYLNSVVCTPSNSPTFVYDYVFELDSDQHLDAMMRSIRINDKEQLNLWCTDPQKRVILKDFNVEAKTRDINGKHLNTRKISFKDCK